MFAYVKFYFNSLYKATDKLYSMRDIATQYGFITVNDYYDICDSSSTSNYRCSKYGWTEEQIKSTNVKRVDSGAWIIDLPDPLHIADIADTFEENDTPTPDSEPQPLNIVLHTNEVSDPDAVLAEIFKHIQTVKDRMINLSIM